MSATRSLSRHTRSRCASATLAALIVAGAAAPSLADAFSTYGRHYRGFATPPIGNGSFGVAGDALPDGRLLMVTGNSVFLESAAGSAVFSEVATLDESRTGGTTDPAFLTVSPDGRRIAIGTGFGKPVAVFDSAALGTPDAPTTLTSGSLADYFTVGHFDGTWFDNTSLALTAGEFGQPSFVSMLDTTSSPDNPANQTVVSNILGGSAGIAFDSAGRLYTANGFAYGTGSDTGNIRAFEPADWINGADFESDGTLIGDILSGNTLNLDADGNLFVGGGDFNNFDAGYLGVVSAHAIADALAGSGPIDPNNPLHLARLDPRLDGFGFFGSAFNPATGELYITDGQTWYATVPAPSSLSLLAAAGIIARRRRRD